MLVSSAGVAAACAESSDANQGGPLFDAASEASSDAGAGDVEVEADAAGAAMPDASDAEAGATCGNGVIDPGEGCDGASFGDLTCESIGLGAGTLQCNTSCGVVVTGCGAVEQCTNGFDDDFDFFTDCDDPDCASIALCQDACSSPDSIMFIPAFDFGSTEGKPATLEPSCSPTSGSEAVFRFVPSTSEDLRFTVNADDDVSLSIRTDCGEVSSEVACTNEETGFFAVETIDFAVEAGTEYFVIIDAIGPAGFFDLDVAPPPVESSCTDLLDDDGDGAVDCDDSECTSSADCVPGTKAVGAPCFSNTECSSGANDPVCLKAGLGFVAGYCSEFCVVGGSECRGDAECVATGLSTNGVCLDGCELDGGATSDAGSSDAAPDASADGGVADSAGGEDSAGCRPGYLCLDRGVGSRVCSPPAETSCEDFDDDDSDGDIDCADADCKGRSECVAGAGAFGEDCTKASDCAASDGGPICLTEATWSFPGGYCSEHCSSSCGLDGVCLPYLAGGSSVCFKACSATTDCRTGYTCTTVSPSEKACTP